MKFKATIPMVWGLAKSPELSMDGEMLHIFVEARTGKDSLKKLTQRELNDVARALIALKPQKEKEAGRGNRATVWQRKKLQKLVEEIGWDNPARLNGLAKRMFGVAAVEWLDSAQCSKLTEALKKIKGRKVVTDAEKTAADGAAVSPSGDDGQCS